MLYPNFEKRKDRIYINQFDNKESFVSCTDYQVKLKERISRRIRENLNDRQGQPALTYIIKIDNVERLL